MKYLFWIFILLLQYTYAQNSTMRIGENVYPSESIYYGNDDIIKFHVVKDNKKAIIIFEEFYRVAGTVTFFLEDNTTIKLIDRQKYDHYNDTYLSMYYLTEQEVNRLKENDISTIRVSKLIFEDGSIDGAQVYSGIHVKYKYNPGLKISEKIVTYEETNKTFKLVFDENEEEEKITLNFETDSISLFDNKGIYYSSGYNKRIKIFEGEKIEIYATETEIYYINDLVLDSEKNLFIFNCKNKSGKSCTIRMHSIFSSDMLLSINFENYGTIYKMNMIP